MSQPAGDFNAFIDYSRRSFAPALRFSDFAARTLERFARLQYEVAGDYLNLGLAQVQANVQTQDVAALLARHSELANAFVEKQTQRGQDLLRIASDLQAEIGSAA